MCHKLQTSALPWPTDNFDSLDKPSAMVETNDTAERLEMPKAKVTSRGTPEKQATYMWTLLALANRKRFQFVVLFIHQDYDRLGDTIQAIEDVNGVPGPLPRLTVEPQVSHSSGGDLKACDFPVRIPFELE